MTRPITMATRRELVALLPADRPFTASEADQRGVGPGWRRLLLESDLLVRRFPGVLHVAELADTLELRLQCLALVVPPDCVVTDRTAAWVWVGERALAPGDHLCTPRPSVFAPPGRRLRNVLAVSGERSLLPCDVTEIGGVRVTRPLRTACDLGRLLPLDQAFAAMDSLATTGDFDVEELVAELDRFKGYRGIVQARTWAPYVDPRSQSQFESIGRRHWLAAGLPRPDCQCPVDAPSGGWYHVDYGLPDEHFGGEFFGEEFHGDGQAPADEERLVWLREARAWVIVVARKQHLVAPRYDYQMRLRHEWERHRAARRVVA